MISRRAVLWVFFGVVAASGTAACKKGGGGGDGGSGGGTADAPVVLPPSGGQSCATDSSCDDQAAIDAYAACIVSTCDSEYQQCFGADYATGTFGGDCKDLMDCSSQCASCDETCLKACSDQHLAGACKDCITGPIADCAVQAITSGTCKLPCGPDVGGGGGGACDDLAACCGSLTGDDQMQCQNTYDGVKLGGDLPCSQALNIYTSSGKCQ